MPPHPTPSWGQAPALHFSWDPGLSLFGRRWLVSPTGAGNDPGSECGTCFRTNRSCRLAPAHEGMKSRSCGLVQRVGTADSATPHPLPAGDKPPRYIFSFRPRPSVYKLHIQFGARQVYVDWSLVGVRELELRTDRITALPI